MYIFITQCFASRLGGIESMMTNLALSLAIKKKVKVFADQNSVIQDEVFDLEHEEFLHIFRYGGIKFLRRRKKARDIKLFIENNKIEGIFADTWKSLELSIDKINFYKIPVICLAHGNELLYENDKRKKRILYTLNKIKNIVANSEFTSGLIRNLGIKNDNIYVVNPGAKDLNNIKSTNQYNFKGNPVLLTLARLEKRKGHKKVIDSIKILEKEFPQIQYIIAGEGPEKQSILQYAKKINILDRINFIGNINDEQKKEIFMKSTLMIMPTIDETSNRSIEGFGVVYIEAAMLGLCSVATNVGGVNDAIIDGVTGILLNPNEDLSVKLKQLLSDNIKLKKLNLKAQQRAQKHFKWNDVLKKYLNILDN